MNRPQSATRLNIREVKIGNFLNLSCDILALRNNVNKHIQLEICFRD